MFVIKIDETYYKAAWGGIGQITPHVDRARKYKSKLGAKIGLSRLRKYKSFPSATVINLPTTDTKGE